MVSKQGEDGKMRAALQMFRIANIEKWLRIGKRRPVTGFQEISRQPTDHGSSGRRDSASDIGEDVPLNRPFPASTLYNLPSAAIRNGWV